MKKIWKENRVLFVLILILIICFIAICSVVLSYFMGSGKSVYGDRLENKVEIKKEVKEEYLKALEEDKLISSVDFRVSIRTIYVDILFNEDVTLVEAQSKAAASLDNLDEEILSYYDVNFILNKDKTEKDAGFTIMGARNSNGTGISWNNNTVIKETEEE